jgi:hypothetical protein
MNSDVAQAQSALNQVLHAGLKVDGISGPATRRAVVAFQRSKGLTPDGILGPKTYAALGIKPPGGSYPQPQPPAGPVAPEIREITPALLTLYFRMPHGSEGSAKPLTGVFFPQNFRTDAPLDCIVWLQGHHPTAPSMSIDRYLSGKWIPTFAFREPINDAGKNVVLIAPTLGPHSEAGNLVKPGGFDRWLDNVISSIGIYGPYGGTVPSVRYLALACHSGGGQPMRQIARGTAKYASNLRECWGFDCMYNWPDPTEWPDWAKKNPDKRLYVYWAHTTAAYSQKLAAAKLPNLIVEKSSTGDHNRVPITYWKERILNFRP